MKRTLSLFVLSLVIAASAQAREGFGFTKKAVDMSRTVPPTLTLGARRVKLNVTAQRTSDNDDAQTLKNYIEEAILAGAGTLASGAKGDVNVSVTIDRLESYESWETRTDYEYRQTGTKQEWNSKSQKYETKPVYASVPVTKNVKAMSGSIAGAFDIGDKSGVLDSGDIGQQFSKKYDDGQNAPTPAKIEDDMMRRAATMVASRIVPTKDRVTVLMPKGSFEAFIPLAEAGQWDRYLASVEGIAELRDKRAEAYRQYALGVAKEAVAYSTDDNRRALDLMRESVTHYQNAINYNPSETLFSQAYSSLLSRGTSAPLARANASLTAYEKWVGPRGSMLASSSSGSSKTPAPTGVASAAGVPGANILTNALIVDMAKAGLSDENIMLAIDSADRTNFDVSPTALIELRKGGVSKVVIAHMQKKKKG